MKKIFFFMLEHFHCFYFSLGHNVRLKQFQVSQTLITVSHCLMTNAYFQPCIQLLHYHKMSKIWTLFPRLQHLFNFDSPLSPSNSRFNLNKKCQNNRSSQTQKFQNLRQPSELTKNHVGKILLSQFLSTTAKGNLQQQNFAIVTLSLNSQSNYLGSVLDKKSC